MLIFRYDTQWYRVSLREQKLMLFILHRSMQSCKLITGGTFVLSLEGFTTVNNDHHDVLTRFLTVTLIYLIAASCHIHILFYSIIICPVVIAIIMKIIMKIKLCLYVNFFAYLSRITYHWRCLQIDYFFMANILLDLWTNTISYQYKCLLHVFVYYFKVYVKLVKSLRWYN